MVALRRTTRELREVSGPGRFPRLMPNPYRFRRIDGGIPAKLTERLCGERCPTAEIVERGPDESEGSFVSLYASNLLRGLSSAQDALQDRSCAHKRRPSLELPGMAGQLQVLHENRS
jgi:hypothetical protein